MRVECIDALFSTRQFAASRSTVCKDYAEDNIEGGKSLLVISNGRAKFRPA
jgi:hypothetical protein